MGCEDKAESTSRTEPNSDPIIEDKSLDVDIFLVDEFAGSISSPNSNDALSSSVRFERAVPLNVERDRSELLLFLLLILSNVSPTDNTPTADPRCCCCCCG